MYFSDMADKITPVLQIGQFDEFTSGHDVYVNRFSEHVRKHHAHILRPHKHAFYLTVMFTSGSGFHEIDFVRYSIEPGAVFLLRPGQTHHWEFTDDTEGWVFFHSDSFWNFHVPDWSLQELPFFRSQRHTSAFLMKNLALDELNHCFSQLWKEYQTDLPYRYRKIALLIQTSYIELARNVPTVGEVLKSAGEYQTRFQLLEQLIETHYLTEKSPGFYATQLSVSERHLQRIVKQFTGKSTLQIITERIILEAKRLLGAGQLRPGEIAQLLGYEEYSYFSRQFRQYCGMSPREFKQQYD